MAHVKWEKGGEADVVKLEGEAVSLRSTIPSPPGSRLTGSFSPGNHEIRVKVHASKKQPDGAFLLEGRLIDATRELRGRIAQVLQPAPSGDKP